MTSISPFILTIDIGSYLNSHCLALSPLHSKIQQSAGLILPRMRCKGRRYLSQFQILPPYSFAYTWLYFPLQVPVIEFPLSCDLQFLGSFGRNTVILPIVGASFMPGRIVRYIHFIYSSFRFILLSLISLLKTICYDRCKSDSKGFLYIRLTGLW